MGGRCSGVCTDGELMRGFGGNAVVQAAVVGFVVVHLSSRALVEMCCRRSRVRPVSPSTVDAWADVVAKALHLQYQLRLFTHVGTYLQELKMAGREIAALGAQRSKIRSFWARLGHVLRRARGNGKAD